MSLTPKEYAKNTDICPVCESESVEGNSPTFTPTGGWLECGCLECGASWDILFSAVGYDNLHHESKKESREFKVIWEIDVTADTPENAAREAWETMQAKGSTANYFTVASPDGTTKDVDLELENS